MPHWGLIKRAVFPMLFLPILNHSCKAQVEQKKYDAIQISSYLIRNPKLNTHLGNITPELRTNLSFGIYYYFIHFYNKNKLNIEGGFGIGNNTITILPKLSQEFYDSTLYTEKDLKSTFLGTAFSAFASRTRYDVFTSTKWNVSILANLDWRIYFPLDFVKKNGYFNNAWQYYEISYVHLDGAWSNVPTFSLTPELGLEYKMGKRKSFHVGVLYRFAFPNNFISYNGSYVFLRSHTEESAGEFSMNESGFSIFVSIGILRKRSDHIE